MLASGRKKAGRGGWFLFWLAFFIGITLLFMLNLEKIKGTLSNTKLLERLLKNNEEETEEDANELERHILELASASEGPALTGSADSQPIAASQTTASQQAAASQPAAETSQPAAAQTAAIVTQPAVQGQINRNEPNSVQEKTVSRMVYLMRVGNAGTILWTGVKRDLPASDRPLFDALEALIKGPSAAEEKQGLMSLIPKNVKIQNAVIQGNTAYISFNEDFLFNTYGVEGYASQRRQIVLTATEFSNVKDVQILIDGKRVDYLGEGIWIGGPVSRSNL